MSLLAVDYGDNIKIGLLRTRDEFGAFVKKKFAPDASSIDSVFDMTSAHVALVVHIK